MTLPHFQSSHVNLAADVHPGGDFELAAFRNNPPGFSVSTIRHKDVSLSDHDGYEGTFVSDHWCFDSWSITGGAHTF